MYAILSADDDPKADVSGGMNISKALIEGTIDAGIGLENVQQVELEEWCKSQGRDPNDVHRSYYAGRDEC